MKFDSLFTDGKASLCHPHLLRGKKKHPCWQCWSMTNWIEINFEAYICSTECEAIAWKAFWEACNKDC